MKKTLLSLFFICLTPIVFFANDFPIGTDYQDSGIKKESTFLQNRRTLPYLGTTFVLPKMGVSSRFDGEQYGSEMNFQIGGVPKHTVFASADARVLGFIDNEHHLYYGYGAGGGITKITISDYYEPNTTLPYLYPVVCVGAQGEHGFVDLGVEGVVTLGKPGIFPLPSIRAGFKF